MEKRSGENPGNIWKMWRAWESLGEYLGKHGGTDGAMDMMVTFWSFKIAISQAHLSMIHLVFMPVRLVDDLAYFLGSSTATAKIDWGLQGHTV